MGAKGSSLVVFVGAYLSYILMGSRSFWTTCLVGTGTYIATSFYLLRNPRAKHRRTNPHSPAVLIAHRGGAGEAYENTMEAFKRAVAVGADMLELDVHLSKDGYVVVAHDQQLERLTGVKTMINQRDYSCLPCLKSEVSVDFCPGQTYCDPHIGDEERRFPLLSEVLSSFPTTQVNIDIKDPEPELVAKVDYIIRQHKAEDRCVWGNFNQETTENCYDKNPDVGILFSMSRVVKLYILFYTGFLPFVSLKETHLEIPMPSSFLNPMYRTPEGNVNLARLSPLMLSLIDWLLMSPLLFRHLKSRGVYTYLWVLNNEEEYEKAFRIGATGIMTDYPSRLRKFLDEKKLS